MRNSYAKFNKFDLQTGTACKSFALFKRIVGNSPVAIHI